jgi:hypothetical protein
VAGKKIHGRAADESGYEDVRGAAVDFRRRVVLLEDAVLENRDAAGEGHGFDLIVGDVDGDDGELMLQVLELGAHVDAQTGIEIGERLVHEERLRMADDGSGKCDALTLASGKLLGEIGQESAEAEAGGDTFHLYRNFGRGTLADAQRESDIFGDGHVRIERVALEYHRDVAVAGFQASDVLATEKDGACVGFFQAGDDAEKGGFSAAGWAEEDDEFPVSGLQAHVAEGVFGAEFLGDVFDAEAHVGVPVTALGGRGSEDVAST